MDRGLLKSFSRRAFLLQGIALAAFLCLPRRADAGAQKEEDLADEVALAMSSFVQSTNPPRLIFSTEEAAKGWRRTMDSRLMHFVDSPYERRLILVNAQYEASRAGLDPQLILGLIEVESRFRRYAISSAGARGLMQVMPFWVRLIGKPDHDLFDPRVNLRYGCAILRYYLNREKGDLFAALGRYNGSLGASAYPNAVLGATKHRWHYAGPW